MGCATTFTHALGRCYAGNAGLPQGGVFCFRDDRRNSYIFPWVCEILLAVERQTPPDSTWAPFRPEQTTGACPTVFAAFLCNLVVIREHMPFTLRHQQVLVWVAHLQGSEVALPHVLCRRPTRKMWVTVVIGTIPGVG